MEQRPATCADLEALPEHLVGELIDGVLYTRSTLDPPHAQAASRLGALLGRPFDLGQDGPGGWHILDKPGLRLGEDVPVPDLAGWRHERLPKLPRSGDITVPPDWVCEVLSPSTEAHVRVVKIHFYARAGIRYVWLVTPDAQMIEVYRLHGAHYLLLAVHGEAERVRAEPFEALELALELLWGS